MSYTSTWAADTQTLLSSGGVSVSVYSATFDYSVHPAKPDASSLVETKTVHIYPIRGDLRKDLKGIAAGSTHKIMFPLTSTVAVTHKIRKSGKTDYYEALHVAAYEDHNEVWAKKVENR